MIIADESCEVEVTTFMSFSAGDCNNTKPNRLNRFVNETFINGNGNFFPDKMKNLNRCPIRVSISNTTVDICESFPKRKQKSLPSRLWTHQRAIKSLELYNPFHFRGRRRIFLRKWDFGRTFASFTRPRSRCVNFRLVVENKSFELLRQHASSRQRSDNFHSSAR